MVEELLLQLSPCLDQLTTARCCLYAQQGGYLIMTITLDHT